MGCSCRYCGYLIEPGEFYFAGAEGYLHQECLKDYVEDEYSEAEYARAFGYERRFYDTVSN